MTLTPKQLKYLATKDDVNDIKRDMATKTELQEVKSDVLSAADAVMKKLDNIEHAFVSNMAAHDRFEQAINNLNARVTHLERKK